MSHFSGSYRAADATFLLKPIVADFVDLGTKEELIQSGRRHYSEMISFEPAPSDEYTRLFRDLTARHKYRLAGEIMGLARVIADSRADPLSLISLARAGTPVGALLARALRRLGRTETKHYSISIIRDRGIDTNALESILRRDQRPAEGLVFVDGWTGKGVITRELQRADIDCDRNPHRHAHADGHSNCYADSHAHRDSDTDCNANTCADCHADTYAGIDSHAHRRSEGRCRCNDHRRTSRTRLVANVDRSEPPSTPR